jgi:hypothetical protein
MARPPGPGGGRGQRRGAELDRASPGSAPRLTRCSHQAHHVSTEVHLPFIAFSVVADELNFLFSGGEITGQERQAYLDRMQSLQDTPWQIHKELEQRFGGPGGHGAIRDPHPPEDEIFIDPEEADPDGDGRSKLHYVLAFAAIANIATRLAPYVIRIGVGAGSRVRMPLSGALRLQRDNPAVFNTLNAALLGAGQVGLGVFEDDLRRAEEEGDLDATVLDIEGTPGQLAHFSGDNGTMGLTLVPGLGNLPPGVFIVKRWQAPRDGGVQFYKFSNGLIAVQKLDGTWKVYRPKKPIVLYAGVGNNRRSIMRAAHIVRAEVKAWKSMEKFFGLHRRKALPAPKRGRSVVIEHGSGSIVAD